MTFEERIDRLTERHEALTQSVELMARMQAHAAEKYEERFLRTEEKYEERVLQTEERLLDLAERQSEFAEQHHREIAEIRRELGRAVRLSVQETRNERKRRQEMAAEADKRHRELEEATNKRHGELQDLLRAFLERGGNGNKH